MNFYDSERMTDLMKPLGYEISDSVEDADLVVLNTCHIREKATEKLYSELGRIKRHKKKKQAKGSEMLIAVSGCVGQAEGEEIITRAPYVDMVMGPQTYHQLPEMVARVSRKSGEVIELDFKPEEKFDALSKTESSGGASKFLTVQEGCDKFCTFCVVPYTRGAEYSRPSGDILVEAEKLAKSGAVELNLLGQNVNAYLDDKGISLAKLIKQIAKIPAIQRIRYTTSHPKDMTDELIEAHAEVDKLMPYLHLPVQAGSNDILKAMNRKHTAEEYLAILERMKKARPDIAFSSDFIVGFPSETERDFQKTMDIVAEVGYQSAYSFKYSIRPGTPAGAMENQVPEEVKSERLERLQKLILQKQLEFNQNTVGRVVSVLFEREGKLDGQVVGKSPYMQSVHLLEGEQFLNQIVNVKITSAYHNSVKGEYCDNSAYIKAA